MPKCPVCGTELKPVGYPVDGWQYYECPNGCNFEKPLSWKIQDAVAVVLFLLLFIVTAVILLPFGIAIRIKDRRCKHGQ